MSLEAIAFFVSVLAGGSAASSGEPLACQISALSAAERERHHALAEKLRGAIVERTELSDGYELALDLKRLPADSRGLPFCVVEVAEWVDLEARCCPFLDFQIDLRGKSGDVRLRLTGGQDVKSFLKTELPILQSDAR